MPVSPDTAEDLASAVSTLYEAAELALIERVTAALAQGLDSPLWTTLKLQAIGQLRTAIEDIIAALQVNATGAIHTAVAEAYNRGTQAAVVELGAVAPTVAAVPAGTRAVDRLAAALVQETSATHTRILRTGMDVYRQTVAEATSAPLLGAQTRRQAAERALEKFAAKGVTGFVDRSGKAWNLTSYAEMATRSALGRAAVEAHTDQLAAYGVDLVIVSDAPEECPRCKPWEGKILTREGTGGEQTIEAEHATEDDEMVSVHVAGSLPEARAAGLMHPNCRHSISIYLPGLTKPPEKKERTRATYEQSQQQRYLERQVRAWKRRAAGSVDDDKRAKANARVRDYQKRIRELTAETGLPRKSHREQIDTAARPATAEQPARPAQRAVR